MMSSRNGNRREGSGAVAGFEPVRQQRVHEQVANQLRDRILAGMLNPGERLPHEQHLIEEFQVSRSAVRQAMQLLEQQGLVDVLVGSGGGCFVAPTRLGPIRRSFTNLLALRGISADEFLAAKAEIEPAVFAVAARNIQPNQVDELRSNLDACRRVADHGPGGQGVDDALFVLAHDFHLIIGRATGNQLLEMVLAALVDAVQHIPRFRGAPVGGWNDVIDDHEALLGCLEQGDELQVRMVAQRHASSVRSAFLERVGEGPEQS